MKVLIVDDSRLMRLVIKQSLQEAGFKNLVTAEAESAQEAVKVLHEFKPDLMLLDWLMPEMNGPELIELLKRERVRVKYGFVTSLKSDDMKKKAVEAGALFFITKPFTSETLKRTLKNILG